ncbi:MAG: glycosyl transferase family protein [Candidatus Peribacteria bacterium]|nr:glycosyl transferase family protein [Candidatus Peribacteria bacterium]
MEPHPPLGKLLIALGEKIVDANPATVKGGTQDNNFLSTDYGREFPKDFSFAGYRLFPALLAWLTAPLLFLIFLLITRNALASTLFSFFYVFDNALIVHMRGAMLESTLLFFSAAVILAFLLLLEPQKNTQRFMWASALFGASFGLALATKVVALVLVLAIPALLWKLWPNTRRMGQFAVVSLVTFLIAYCGVWYLHFSIAKTVNPLLPDKGYYQASETYKRILTQKKTGSLLAFPVMLRDSITFVGHYNNGAPRLDLAKSDENGSPWFLWPLGARTINYRWETPDSKVYRYLYLQSNPVVWLVSLFAVLASFALLLTNAIASPAQTVRQPFLLFFFTFLYTGYMAGISQIHRVMYLYHYFLPLMISFILVAIVWMNIQRLGKFVISEEQKLTGLMILAGLICISYQFYRPLTYYEPLSKEQVQHRAILPVWELTCIGCPKENMFAIPRADN